jgi:hypothetical protein
MGITLALTPTINTLSTTLVHNGTIIPPSDTILFHLLRSPQKEYLSPVLEHNIEWLPQEKIPEITSYSPLPPCLTTGSKATSF